MFVLCTRVVVLMLGFHVLLDIPLSETTFPLAYAAQTADTAAIQVLDPVVVSATKHLCESSYAGHGCATSRPTVNH